jgi:hypothetical protein
MSPRITRISTPSTMPSPAGSDHARVSSLLRWTPCPECIRGRSIVQQRHAERWLLTRSRSVGVSDLFVQFGLAGSGVDDDHGEVLDWWPVVSGAGGVGRFGPPSLLEMPGLVITQAGCLGAESTHTDRRVAVNERPSRLP